MRRKKPKPHKLTPSLVPTKERLSFGIAETGQVLGIGRNSVYVLIADGALRTFKLNGRRLVVGDDVRALVSRKAA